MKRYRYLLVGMSLMASAANLAQAQNIVQVHIDNSTTLERALGDGWPGIDSLVVTGQASSDDLKMLRRCIYDGVTTGVDLSQCSVPQNTLPDAAFMAEFKPDEAGAIQPMQQLRYMTLPNNLVAISEYAFAYTGIRSISFPASLVTVGKKAFYCCRSLSGEVNLPGSVNVVGESAFCESWHIAAAHLSGEATIGDLAFYHVPLLRSVDIRDRCRVGNRCFWGAMSLTDLNMGDEVSLASYAFAYCSGLEQVALPRLLQDVETGVFYQCGLKQLQWPDVQGARDGGSYYRVGTDAFAGSRFKAIEVPDGVTAISGGAFSDNPDLEMVVLPDGLLQLNFGAFDACPGLVAIYSKAIVPCYMTLVDSDYFLFDQATLYIPAGTMATYKSRPGWKEFKKIVEVEAFPQTMVDDIVAPVADDGIYYDLRGIPVANPSHGLYIHQGRVVAVP